MMRGWIMRFSSAINENAFKSAINENVFKNATKAGRIEEILEYVRERRKRIPCRQAKPRELAEIDLEIEFDDLDQE